MLSPSATCQVGVCRQVLAVVQSATTKRYRCPLIQVGSAFPRWSIQDGPAGPKHWHSTLGAIRFTSCTRVTYMHETSQAVSLGNEFGMSKRTHMDGNRSTQTHDDNTIQHVISGGTATSYSMTSTERYTVHLTQKLQCIPPRRQCMDETDTVTWITDKSASTIQRRGDHELRTYLLLMVARATLLLRVLSRRPAKL